MKYYSETLKKAGKELKLELNELPLVVSLVTGLVFTGAFIEDETDGYLSLNITREDFAEEFHIIPKDNIEFVKIMYAPMEEYEEADCDGRIYN